MELTKEAEEQNDKTLPSENETLEVKSAATVKASKKRKNEEDGMCLTRRKIRVAGAPKLPLSGYVRYMNDRREKLRKEQPNKSAIEHTKIIAEEWSGMSEEIKKPYISAADNDKQRYASELQNFLKDHPEVLANELAKNKANKEKSCKLNGNAKLPAKEPKSSPENVENNTEEVLVQTAAAAPISLTAAGGPLFGEIPIFTNEFLEHNKHFDQELRNLRRAKADLEQQNSVLEKHVENMKFGVEKITSENESLIEKNRMNEIYLEKLKRRLAQAMSAQNAVEANSLNESG